jgi:hypothetical protein
MCKICNHPQNAEILRTYARQGSLRRTASQYNVSYRTLLRHLDECVHYLQNEVEELQYRQAFKETAEYLRNFYSQTYYRKPRPKSIITKQVEFKWSRRSWKKAENSPNKPLGRERFGTK